MSELEKRVREKYVKITKSLIEKGLTVSTMESCTAGQVISLITDTEGSSGAVKGAFVTYSNEAKIMQGVPADTISKFGVYSEETACAMAQACRKTYAADIGIGITGSLSNVDPANNDSIPGQVHFAIETPDGTKACTHSVPCDGGRYESKLYIADLVADKLLTETLQNIQ